MPKYHGSLVLAIADNSTRKCKFRGCHKKRYRISGYCTTHTAKNSRYGDPSGGIRKSAYGVERAEVKKIIERNHEHKGILYATDFINRWLQDAYDGKSIVACDHFRRLKDAGITGKDILIECCAIWLFAQWRPDQIRSDRHLTYTLGHKVVRISPYWHYVNGPAAREVGDHLRKNLGTLFVNVARAAERKEAEHQVKLKILGQPLTLT